ncbi:MAG: hypothetical protein AABN33_26890 [Acidobacteriota bacterium]
MNTQKTIIVVTAILAVAGVLSYYIYQENNRYMITNAGAPGVIYEIDKKTGRTWILQGGSKVEQKDPEVEKTLEEATLQQLPALECLKITGDADLSGFDIGHFSGKLYNGSNWTVKRFVVRLRCSERDGAERWTREFNVLKGISPLTTESFSLNVTGYQGNPKVEWSLAEIYGRPR